MDPIQKFLDEIDISTAAIGGTIGLGTAAVAWGKERSKLSRALKGCKSKKCTDSIKKRIRKLKKLTLAKGVAKGGLAMGRISSGISFAKKSK